MNFLDPFCVLSINDTGGLFEFVLNYTMAVCPCSETVQINLLDNIKARESAMLQMCLNVGQVSSLLLS